VQQVDELNSSAGRQRMTDKEWIGIFIGAGLVAFLLLLGVFVLLDYLGLFGRNHWD